MTPGQIIVLVAVADRRFHLPRETPVWACPENDTCDGCQRPIAKDEPVVISDDIPRFQPDGQVFCRNCVTEMPNGIQHPTRSTGGGARSS